METGVRVQQGTDVLDRCGDEAAALGSRALLVSSARDEKRKAAVLERLGQLLRRAGVGIHPFPAVPPPGSPLDRCIAVAAEAARESRCRLVIGVGDHRSLQVARGAAAQAWLPSLLVPTAVGYGPPAPTDAYPMPDTLVLDPVVGAGSSAERTAELGVALFSGLLERHAGGGGSWPGEDLTVQLESALRLLVDFLPGAIADPDDLGARQKLVGAMACAVDAMTILGQGARPLEDMVLQLAGGARDADPLRAALLPAALELAADGRGPLDRSRVARFGRCVLEVREDDDGRAASWTAGGIRQWVLNLGLDPRLPAGRSTQERSEPLRALLAAARR
jgi:alcohol dehydrogenase YqhD (iron-dependent ADH family)